MNQGRFTRWFSIIIVSVFLSRVAAADQPGRLDPCDELRTKLAVAELERATLTHRVKELEARLSESKEPERLRSRAEASETAAAKAKRQADALQSRVTSLEAERKRLLDELARLRSATKPATTAPKPDVPAGRNGWRHFEDTSIDGMVQEIKHGTLFKTMSGTIYEVTDFVFEFPFRSNPDTVVLTDGLTYKLIIDGVERLILCAKIAGGSHEGAGGEVVDSRIAEAFEGFEFGNLFKLDNGQVWEQSSSKYRYKYKYRPKVTIWRVGATWKMKVDGVQDIVSVVRRK